MNIRRRRGHRLSFWAAEMGQQDEIAMSSYQVFVFFGFERNLLI